MPNNPTENSYYKSFDHVIRRLQMDGYASLELLAIIISSNLIFCSHTHAHVRRHARTRINVSYCVRGLVMCTNLALGSCMFGSIY